MRAPGARPRPRSAASAATTNSPRPLVPGTSSCRGMLLVGGPPVGVSPSLLSELDRMPAELERLVRDVPAEHLRWLPPDSGGAPGETFSALGHVCHLRDIEADGYHVRVRRMLEEERPSLVSIDGYELARERRYDEADLEDALAAFRAARGRTLDTLRALTDAQLDRVGRVRRVRRADAARAAALPAQPRPAAPGRAAVAARAHPLRRLADRPQRSSRIGKWPSSGPNRETWTRW